MSDPRDPLVDLLSDRRHDPAAPARAEVWQVVEALTRRWQAIGFQAAFADFMRIYRGARGAPEERRGHG